MSDSRFLIGGTIVADDSQRFAYEDVTPAQVRAAISHLGNGDGITFEISSPGGDVTAGIAIANLIRAASVAGHRSTAHVVGVAASMASVIACACDEIEIDESAFVMIHNPWTVAHGDSAELRKSADILDKMRDAIMGFYRSKFDRTDDEIRSLMDDETWFTGTECAAYGLRANVVPNAEPLKAAACARALPSFAKTPTNAAGLFVLGKEQQTMSEIKIEAAVEETAQDTQEAPATAPAQDAVEETAKPAEAPVAPSVPAQDAVEETVPLAECERRVSGMQSAMAKQLDALRADYEAKLADVRDTAATAEANFKAQLAARDEELTKANAEVTRLAEAAKKTESELRETASALKAKSDALATLNAAVNAPAPVSSYGDLMSAAKTPEAREALRARKRRGEIN